MKNVLIAAALLAASTSVNANLIVNGSFEDPKQKAGEFTIYPNGITGWESLSGAGIEVRNSLVGEASHGFNFVELDSDNNSSMQQTISTVNGSLYTLLFDYSPRIGVASASNGIKVFWNNVWLEPVITGNGIGATQNNWQTYSFNLLGTGSDTLKFLAVGTNESLGGNLDNVRLNAVPVPAAAWLFASALGLFGFARRRSI